jgi:hypothetical protein
MPVGAANATALGAVVAVVLFLVLVVALAQAREKVMLRLALLGLAVTGITGLAMGVVSLCTMLDASGFRGAAGGYALVGSAIAFAALGAYCIYRPKE